MALLEKIRTEGEWKQFFNELKDIPADDCDKYAKSFVQNRVTEISIQTVDKQDLRDMGVTALGDVKIIMNKIKSLDVAGNQNDGSSRVSSHVKMSPQEVPKVKMGMTRIEFAKFRHDWSNLKVLANIPPGLCTRYLYTACDTAPSVQNSILFHHPQYATEAESTILDYIEQVVTKDSNKAVYRLQFRKLCQADHESSKAYITRLQQNAEPCEFMCPHCSKSTADSHIRDQFLIGLSSPCIQRDLMAEDNSLDTLEKMVNRATQLEVVASDQNILSTQSSATTTAVYGLNDRMKPSSVKPQRRRNKITYPNKPESSKSSSQAVEHCAYCGLPGYHGARPTERKKRCPAFGKKCRNCNKFNHLEKVCQADKSNVYELDTDSDGSSDAAQAILLAEIKATDEVHEITVQAIPDVDGSGHFPTDAVRHIKVFPDSGAGICLGDANHARALGLQMDSMTECYKRVKAVGGSTIICRRVIPVQFSIGQHVTVQRVYFTYTKLARMYFSRKGCLGLDILPKTFPFPMTTEQRNPQVSGLLVHSNDTASKSPINNNQTVSEKNNFRRTPPDKPAKIPFEPTEENVSLLKQFIIDSFASSAFDKSAPFPIITGPPAHIELTPDAKAMPRHTANKIPHHLRKATEESIYSDVDRKIIRPLPIGTPTKHCHAMVIGEKKNGQPRRTIDLRPLNKYVVRETHHVPSPFEVASEIPPGTKKTIVDAVDGYHSVILDEESQLLTTFITPFTPNPRFCYIRCPQGLTSANDYYNSRYDAIIQDFPRKAKIVDDVALWDNSIEESFWHTWDFLTLCANNGIVLNKHKFQFCQDTVEFAGLNVNSCGVAPSDKILSAIKNFPEPKDIHGARAWMGLVNQTAWAYAISDIMQPFRELVKPKQTFRWDDHLQKLFDESKKKLIKAVKNGVHSYDIAKPTCIQCDWSKHGVGYLLYQKHCKCDGELPMLNCCNDGWKIVFAGSRCTSDAESRYAPTEGEALAVAYSLNHAYSFVYGCPDLTVVTDHKPLLGIFGDRDLGTIMNPRIQRLKEQTLRYRFKIVHCPGKMQVAADALSRYPAQAVMSAIILDDNSTLENQLAYEMENEVNAVVTNALDQLNNPDGEIKDVYSGVVTLDTIENAGKSDPDYQKLLNVIVSGFPNSKQYCDPEVKVYWDKRHSLSTFQNIVLMNECIVIPKQLRKTILHTLHSAHQGCVGMLNRAQGSVYWPQMRQGILNFRADCMSCHMHAPSLPKEPYIPSDPPEYPFQKLCADYCSVGTRNFLIIADKFSGWLHIYGISHKASSDNLIKHCRKLFSDYGTPEEFSSDGGPQFISEEFESFLKVWGVNHRRSAAYNPQSNGRAELAVKSAKKILRDNVDAQGTLNNNGFARAILQYRNTPIDGFGLSPAQILFNRKLRDFIPNHPKHYKLSTKWIAMSQKREQEMAANNRKLAAYYDHRAHSLPSINIGSHVLVQNKQSKRNFNKWTRSGRVVEALKYRQYKVKMDGSGRVTIRNRRHLRALPASHNHKSLDQVPFLKNKDPSVSRSCMNQPDSIDLSRPDNQIPSANDTTPMPNHSTVLPSAANQRPGRQPRALRNLADFNSPGVQWHPLNSTRRSTTT